MEFKKTHGNLKIGFSTFASMRPKQCILAGAPGTHCVCVCTIHQNVKLMIESSGLRNLLKHSNLNLITYNDFLSLIICNSPTPDCYLNSCSHCPDTSKVTDILRRIFYGSEIDLLTYNQWTQTDRSCLQTITESSDDFINNFLIKLKNLKRHAFIAKQQSHFLKSLKEKLQPYQFVVILDFSENYKFILQDEVQSFHWNNSQSTIHPFGIYYKEENSAEVQHTNLVIISEVLKHNTTLVHLFQRLLNDFLKTKFGRIEKIFYFSDGAAAHYKNKKIS